MSKIHSSDKFENESGNLNNLSHLSRYSQRSFPRHPKSSERISNCLQLRREIAVKHSSWPKSSGSASSAVPSMPNMLSRLRLKKEVGNLSSRVHPDKSKSANMDKCEKDSGKLTKLY